MMKEGVSEARTVFARLPSVKEKTRKQTNSLPMARRKKATQNRGSEFYDRRH